MENENALLREALRLMTEAQKAKLLDSFLRLARQAGIEQKLEEMERQEQLRALGKIDYF
jgi:EAL domain-containing protein (putative c-di-GMP-specific phosphodiesterase class I)